MLILLNWPGKLLERDPFHFCVRRVDGHLFFFAFYGMVPYHAVGPSFASLASFYRCLQLC